MTDEALSIDSIPLLYVPRGARKVMSVLYEPDRDEVHIEYSGERRSAVRCFAGCGMPGFACLVMTEPCGLDEVVFDRLVVIAGGREVGITPVGRFSVLRHLSMPVDRGSVLLDVKSMNVTIEAFRCEQALARMARFDSVLFG